MNEFSRAKINTIQSLLQNEEMNLFQHELVVEDAEKPTGDKDVDAQMKVLANNAKAAILAIKRRLDVRRAKLVELETEMKSE